MTETLGWGDYLTIVIYFAIVIVVGIWSTCRPNRGSSQGYFLAGKNMNWIPVGASLYASNIGAPIFVGLSGSAAASGIAVSIYEWHAVFFLVALGWIFVPVYVSCGSFTTPQYLRKRYGGKRIRTYAAVISLLGYIIFNISAEIFAGAMFLQQLLGWNLYLNVAVILFVTALYTIVGGLAAVIYTDTLQTVILLIGAAILFVTSWLDVGGWGALQEKYMMSAANYTFNNTQYSCGLPREDSFHIVRDAVTGDIPWPGALLGLSTLGMYVWCQDQLMVQRCLSAKNMNHSKGGALLGGFLKLTSFILFVIPGMVSRIKYPEEVACADPDKCFEICQNRAGCSNLAYPLLVLRLLPEGIRGLMLAALLAALMSSLTSILNSASSIITLDVWRMYRKKAKDTELMIVGRVTVLVLVVTSILWLPVMEKVQGGQFWAYMQSIRSYITPPWFILFVLGVFWKRTTEAGAFWGLNVCLVIGIIRMVLDFVYTPPNCGSGEPDTRPFIVRKVNFLHFATILAVISTIVMIVISLLTEPRPERKLRRVTFWTRNDPLEPELDSEDEEIDEEEKRIEVGEEDTAPNEPIENPMGAVGNIKRYCYNWVCGTTDKPKRKLTLEQRRALRAKLTSLHQKKIWRIILNTGAIVVTTITVFVLGVFY
ncbi:sodium/glucose cotransporter 4-like [Pecten maximus]|uniref:sodium/glucose cotransporter 4-like n=1 Tax=Pecten maximus TaxID=6579 RepID=UPI001458C904|nr:sodium/glucose cotransporter 4-like [Pecten maximus]